MKHFWLACLAVILPQLSVAQEYRCNQRDHRCGSESYDKNEYRTSPPVIQPFANPIQTPCQGQTPSSQSYMAQLHPVTCGEGAVGHDRLPLPVAAPVMERWETLRGGQRTDAREVMQEIRQQNIVWRGNLELPMWESWSYQEKVGGFSESRCGTEPYRTTCSRDLEELVPVSREVDDTSRCLEYEELPDDPPPSAPSTGGYSDGYSGGSSGGTYTPPSPPSGFDNSGSSAPTGQGESSRELERESENLRDRYPDSVMRIFDNSRRPAKQGRCIRYAKKTITENVWQSRGTVTYSCTKYRAQYCQWFETRTAQRRCPNVVAPYVLEYAHDPNWKPNGRISNNPLENYHDLLPNKFDLLPGESEEVYVYANSGVSTSLRPSVRIENKWNNYRTQVAIKDGQCRFGMKPQIGFRIHTLSRIKRKAPNPLALPRDAQGRKITPFKFEARTDSKGRPLNGMPVSVSLQDNSRAMILAASEITRTFPDADNAMKGNKDTSAIRKRAVDTSQVGTAITNGFWADTQFKLQMVRLDKWGRQVRVTDSMTKSNAKELDVFGDMVTIDLKGKPGSPTFYRPANVLVPVLGALKTKKNIELSPGQEYTVKLQVVQRGLPWYESGCKNGAATCEGQAAAASAFSEPMLIKFKYDENARRSLGRWIHDIREFFVIF